MPGSADVSRLFFPHGELRPHVLEDMIRSHRFVHLRWLIIAGFVALLLVEKLIYPDFHRPWAVAGCAVALGISNIVFTLLGTRILRIPPGAEGQGSALVLKRMVLFINAQMVSDLLILTVLLRYSGGIENPMAVFYLFHMLIAALLLRPVNALLQGVWALLLFASLISGEYSGVLAPHYSFLPHPEAGEHKDWLYACVTLGVLAAGIFGTLYFTLQISAGLDAQEQKLRETIDALRRSQDAIRDLQARRSRFMQTAAHQLKSPLAGVQTLTGLIHDGVVPAEQVQTTCGRIIQRCREGIIQVTELLALARIQQADPQRRPDQLANVRQVVSRSVERFSPIAKDKQIELRCKLPGSDDPFVQIDNASLNDCVSNLVDNAIKYTPGPGTVTIEVTRGDVPEADTGIVGSLSSRSSKFDATTDLVSISVTDTGMGIDAAMLPKGGDEGSGSIFDAYLRGDNALAAKISGSGLGLAIVREVVEQVGGRVTVRSRPGQGSSFTVTFPARHAPNDAGHVHDTRSSVFVIDPNTSQTNE